MPDFDGLNWKIVQCTLNNMTRPSKSAPSAIPALKQAVIYARVSSKEQEKEGFSIPAQLKLLKDYAGNSGFAIAHEYVDVETAKQAGRAAFGEMVAYLKAHPSVRVMLVEKTDRLYRNLKDWVTVDELEVEIHFPKEGVMLSRELPIVGKVHARDQSADGEELYRQPFGGDAQRNDREGGAGALAVKRSPRISECDRLRWKKTIVPDENIAPIIRSVFEWYARGDISIREATKKLRAAGLVFRKSGDRIPGSTVAKILRNRIYTGRFDWDGKTYQGRYEPIISADLWERVQDVLDGRIGRR